MAQIITVLPLFILFLIWGKYVAHTFFSPSGIMMGIWSLSLVAHMLIAPDFKFSYEAGLVINTLIIAFFIGEFTIFVATNKVDQQEKITLILQNISNKKSFKKKLRKTIIILGTISLIGSMMYFYIFYNYFGSFVNLFTSGWLIRSELAEGFIKVPLIIRAMALLSFSALVLSLSYWICFKFNWFLTLPFLSALIMGIAQAARAATFMMLIMIFIAGYWRDKFKGLKYAGYRLLKRAIIIALLIMIIFTLGLAYRMQTFNIDSFDNQQVTVYKTYAFGAISAFSEFWNQYSSDDDLTLGLYSFASLFQLLGARELPAGFYGDYLNISNTNIDVVTNIYTLFRSLIEDFSFSGAMAYMFLIGAIFAYAFRYATKGNIVATAFIIVAYTMIIYSVFAPLTQHNTILLCFVLPSMILYLIGKNKSKLGSNKLINNGQLHIL